jgi:hypothetical protein
VSILFVLALVAGSVALFFAGVVPILGLDLEGGVSVTLSAPKGTPEAVMNQAVENIRRRVDAFGTAEPTIFVTGTNIEVQIPGLARGSIEERTKNQYCIVGADQNYGCYPTQAAADAALGGVQVAQVTQSVCLTGLGDSSPCFATQKQADAAVKGLEVVAASSLPTPTPTVSPGATSAGAWCISGPDLGSPICDYATEKEANQAIAKVDTSANVNYCLQGQDGTTLSSDLGAACMPTSQEADDALAALRSGT